MNKLLNPDNLFKNHFFLIVLVAFLLLNNGSNLVPKLSTSLNNLFSNKLFRVVAIFLVVYLVRRDVRLALVLTIVFVVTMNLLNNRNILEKFSRENFISSSYGKPVSSCDNYKKDNIKKQGTAYYPLNPSTSSY